MKVLFVDGYESDHSLIGDIFTKRDCKLLEVSSGPEAFRAAHRERLDNAIADLCERNQTDEVDDSYLLVSA